MAERSYGINLNHLTAIEYLSFPASFKEYSQAVLFMLKIKDDFIYEDDLIEKFKGDVEHEIKNGVAPIEAIRFTFPDRFINAGSRRKNEGDQFSPVWFDLWN